ncbi:DNA gyrase subunit B [subsurface metagenome]
MNEKIDVYDLEVPKTHNFALASGVFVHNSAKMARNKENQAILPLKGKILNVEKANPVKTLSSEEITNMITVIGTGVGEQFNIEKLRYGKIIIMCDADSVTSDTPMLIFNDKDEISHKYIGDFVNKCVYPNKHKVSSLSINPGEHKVKKIVNVVKHPLRTSLYNIKTHLGYNISVTPYHSVFVYDKGKINTKATKDINAKDYILLPRSLPRTDKEIIIDLNDLAKDYDIRINLAKNEIKKIPENSCVDLSLKDWEKLKELRMSKKISRKKLGKMLGICPTILQQWEFKNDNVMPRYGLFKRYLSLINCDINKLDFNINVPLKYLQESKSKKSYFKNHTNEIKLQLPFDANLAYLLGWYIGDGCSSKGKKNPYRFSLCIGKDKEYYLDSIKDAIKKSLGVNIILENRKSGDMMIHFNSLSFDLLLKKLGLSGLTAPKKFVPDLMYNSKRGIQINFLKGLLQSDGFILGKKAVIGHSTTSKKLMEGIVFLYRQLDMLPSIVSNKSKDHKYKGIMIRSNYITYNVFIGSIKQLKKAKDIWEDHKNAHKIVNFVNNPKKEYDRKHVINVNKDFQAVKVLKVEKINSNDKFVYDLCVDLNRSFIGGLGGLTLHNTDGEHIKTLLLTFFFRFMPHLIENGNIYVALPPLYRIRKRKDYYVYSDTELKKTIEKLGTTNVTRFKGLGEMSSTQLWDTTMNPKTRKIKKIFIEDAVEADRTFSMLMGNDVQARKKFISENSGEANLDI